LRTNRILTIRAAGSLAALTVTFTFTLLLFRPNLSFANGNLEYTGSRACSPAEEKCILRGRVVRYDSSEPVKLARVRVLETGIVALSGVEGKFDVPVPCGADSVHLSVAHVSYRKIPSMAVETGKSARILIHLRYKLYQSPVIVVVAEDPEKEPIIFDRVEMDPLDISRGALSQTDPLHALKDLPQVSCGTDFDGRFSIRGSSPDANAFFYDGMLFPSPYHLGGLCSIYDVSNIRKFSFSNTPASASSYGATGAVVDVETKDGTQMVEGNSFSLGMLSSSLSTQRFFRGKTTFLSLMARRSYIDLLYEMIRRNDENTRIPNFFDIQVSVVKSVDEKDYVKAGFLMSGDCTHMSADGFVEQEDDESTEIAWNRRLDAFSLIYGRRRSKSSDYWGRALMAWQPYRSDFRLGGSDWEKMMWEGGRGTFRFDLNRRYGYGVLTAGFLASLSDIKHDLNFGRGFWLASRYLEMKRD
jgi:hypothetical protein